MLVKEEKLPYLMIMSIAPGSAHSAGRTFY
jgi:hypothetical protein